MKDLILKIRNKPHKIRQRIILLIALSITAIMVLIWVASLPYRFHNNSRNSANDLRPFNVLKENISNTISK